MAKALLVKTMNGSVVIARIAGTLSIANMTSESSIVINAASRGVAKRRPLRITVKAPPS